MPLYTSSEYSRLSVDHRDHRKSSLEDESLNSNERSDSSLLEKYDLSNLAPRRSPIFSLPTMLNLAIFVISIVTFVLSVQWPVNIDKACLNLHSAYSPALKDINPVYSSVIFNGTLGHPSIYRGDPSPKVDAAWDSLEDVRVMSITEEDVLKLGKTTDAIKIPPQFGGGYLASVELAHQLHCVNFLRKSLSTDYYAPPSPYASLEFLDHPAMVVTHQRHCLEMLRQFVMCHADVGIITHRWVKDFPRPYPDFNTRHQCRNFDSAYQWTIDKQVSEEDGGPPRDWKYEPTKGDVVLDVAP